MGTQCIVHDEAEVRLARALHRGERLLFRVIAATGPPKPWVGFDEFVRPDVSAEDLSWRPSVLVRATSSTSARRHFARVGSQY